MALVGTYRAQALPLYGRLVVADPAVTGTEDADFGACMADTEEAVIGGSRYRIAIKAAQDTLAIAVDLELWDAQPTAEVDAEWTAGREFTVEFPGGQAIVENISAGPVPLQPGEVERLTLPGGAGSHRVAAWHRGRDQAADAVQELWDADEAPDDIDAEYARLAGVEQYLLRIWPI